MKGKQVLIANSLLILGLLSPFFAQNVNYGPKVDKAKHNKPDAKGNYGVVVDEDIFDPGGWGISPESVDGEAQDPKNKDRIIDPKLQGSQTAQELKKTWQHQQGRPKSADVEEPPVKKTKPSKKSGSSDSKQAKPGKKSLNPRPVK
mgnify:CR=1 FL=1